MMIYSRMYMRTGNPVSTNTSSGLYSLDPGSRSDENGLVNPAETRATCYNRFSPRITTMLQHQHRTQSGATIGAQTHVGRAKPQPERIDPIQNPDTPTGNKPYGGIWTSTLRDDGSSAWIDWCRKEEWGISDDMAVWKLAPNPDATILVIDTYDDFRELLDAFGWEIMGKRAVDYERIAADTEYDAMRLTSNGQRDTRFERPGLYGWDVESTVWFDWVFSDVEHVCDVTRTNDLVNQ